MHQDQKRLLIAEAIGYIKPRLTESGRVEASATLTYGTVGVPDFFNDLNACYEMERIKDLHHDQRWIEALIGVGLEASGLSLAKTEGWDWALVCARATAAQRAEAFGLTLGLW